MNNLEFYEKMRAVPENAKKPIGAGRLKGKTDINPMWRIKKLTETFGPVGLGWKYEITKKELVPAGDEIAAFVDINLFVKYDGIDGKWSEAIPGTGGSMLCTRESGGLHVSDECYKMALTDAISVSCKAIGGGADVYWDKDKTKYDTTAPEWTATRSNPEKPKKETEKTGDDVKAVRAELNAKAKEIMSVTGFDATKVNEILCDKCSINKPATKADYEQLLIAAGVMLGELYDRKD